MPGETRFSLRSVRRERESHLVPRVHAARRIRTGVFAMLYKLEHSVRGLKYTLKPYRVGNLEISPLGALK